MLLKSLILRPGGSPVSFGPHQTPDEITYHFTGPADGPHVCDVTDDEHAAHLLALEPRAFVLVHDVPSDGPGYGPATPPAQEGAAPIDEGDEGEETEEEAEREARREAAAEYREVAGKNPGPKWTTEQIIEKTLAFLDGKEED